jgi:hypothetical protein
VRPAALPFPHGGTTNSRTGDHGGWRNVVP